MTHPELQQILSHVDALLPADEDARISAHLAECEACRRVAARERQLSDALRMQVLLTPSAPFERHVLDAVLPMRAREHREQLAIRKYRGLIGLCVLTFAVFLLSGQQSSESPSLLRPVFDSVSTLFAPMRGFIETLLQDAFGKRRIPMAEDSNVLEVLIIALGGLAAFYTLDRLFSPHMRRERLP